MVGVTPGMVTVGRVRVAALVDGVETVGRVMVAAPVEGVESVGTPVGSVERPLTVVVVAVAGVVEGEDVVVEVVLIEDVDDVVDVEAVVVAPVLDVDEPPTCGHRATGTQVFCAFRTHPGRHRQAGRPQLSGQ